MPAESASAVDSREDTRTEAGRAPKARKAGEASVAGVRLTHPERVMYEGQGITKLDLAKYYEDIADWILPYVVDRPIAVVRCPEGSTDTCFYQKQNAETVWLRPPR